MIGWESDNTTVGPAAAAARQSLLQPIPHIIPLHDDGKGLYRFILEHGDFGIHNMSITEDANSLPLVTSVYDWETACIVPAILSDPSMAVEVDLVTNEDAAPSFSLGYLTTQHQPTSKITRYGPNNISRCVLVQIYFIFDFGSNFPSLYSLFSTERPIIN